MLLMANYANPLESYDEETLKHIDAHEGLRDFFDQCFLRDKSTRLNAGQLLQLPFFAEC